MTYDSLPEEEEARIQPRFGQLWTIFGSVEIIVWLKTPRSVTLARVWKCSLLNLCGKVSSPHLNNKLVWEFLFHPSIPTREAIWLDLGCSTWLDLERGQSQNNSPGEWTRFGDFTRSTPKLLLLVDREKAAAESATNNLTYEFFSRMYECNFVILRHHFFGSWVNGTF